MKLNNQQTTALAQEILKKVEENKKKNKISTKEREIANKYIASVSSILSQIDKLNKQKEQLHKNLEKDLKFSVYRYNASTVEAIFKNKEDKSPSLSEIKQKITLESIFEEKSDVQSLIDRLVKEFSK